MSYKTQEQREPEVEVEVPEVEVAEPSESRQSDVDVAEQHPLPFRSHPYADVLPLLRDTDPEAWRQFVEDVRANGIVEPITMLGDQVLDGRNRWLAAVEAGVKVVEGHDTRQLPPGVDPLRFVATKNFHRRHLTTSQKAMAAAALANMRQGERTDLEPSANLQKVSQGQAAQLMNVSPRLVADAVKVAGESPALADQVRRGEKTVGAAKAELRPPACDHGYPKAAGFCDKGCCRHMVLPHRCVVCRKTVPHLAAADSDRRKNAALTPAVKVTFTSAPPSEQTAVPGPEPEVVPSSMTDEQLHEAALEAVEKFTSSLRERVWHRYDETGPGIGTLVAAVMADDGETAHLELWGVDARSHRRLTPVRIPEVPLSAGEWRKIADDMPVPF